MSIKLFRYSMEFNIRITPYHFSMRLQLINIEFHITSEHFKRKNTKTRKIRIFVLIKKKSIKPPEIFRSPRFSSVPTRRKRLPTYSKKKAGSCYKSHFFPTNTTLTPKKATKTGPPQQQQPKKPGTTTMCVHNVK